MSKIRVLLVDDEEDYVHALAERLDIRDVGSRIALNGEQALEMLEQEEKPDVMILDLRMPGIDGMEVLERVKKKHPQIQVIILTGHGSEKEEREARRLGAFEYLRKPADTAQLIDTVRGAWRRSLEAAMEFIKDSAEGFEESMQAAAMAEAGEVDMARSIMGDEDDSAAAEPTSAELLDSVVGEGALKVLLVDDEEDYVRTMAERMEMREYGSEVALDGAEALRMLKEEEVPDVMILDLRMPGMDGLEVLERVKRDFPRLEVIMLTGHGSDEEKREAERLGAFAYLQKPVDFNDLMDVVAQAGRASRKSI